VRMRPISDILDRFPRALREMSLQYGKPVQLRVQGANTLVDRNILEALNDPLMHLLRNAFDHGIESADARDSAGKPSQGTIEIRAFHRNNRTYITISDDGAGIPLNKIRARATQMGLDQTLLAAASDEELLSLIFEPGFSTADSVTALSGRGVGMDVVRNNLKQVRGDIKVNTESGVGTTFTISVPFTLSVARALLTESNGMPMAFPTDVIDEVVMLSPDQIIPSTGGEAFEWDGRMVQLIRLSDWLKFNCPRQIETPENQPAIDVPTVFMVKQGSQTIGLQVDRSWGEQEVAIRQVEGGLPLPAGFNNCTILGDGRVVPLVNVAELLHWVASSDRPQVEPKTPNTFSRLPLIQPSLEPPALPPTNIPFSSGKPTILVVDDSINVRRLLALTLEKAGYQVAQAKDGQDALDKLTAGLQVQAVICDIEMPRLDGYGFLARVKSIPHLAGLPIAMLTSRSGDKHRRLAMSLGAVAYFSKPYNEQVLLKRLDEMLNLAPAL
jgi:two-component system, chemotaxis family, sensor histidine kinase and response regulator PixL